MKLLRRRVQLGRVLFSPQSSVYFLPMAEHKRPRTCAVVTNNAMEVRDSLDVISAFVPSTDFIFFAVASRMCRDVWGKRSTETQAVTTHSTPTQLQACFDMGLGVSAAPVLRAAEIGRVDLMEVAYNAGCPFVRKAAARAARFGHIEALKYARSKGSSVNVCISNIAASNGHVHILQWLRSINCDLNETTCYSAARKGHLPCLKYLRSIGCKWDVLVCSAAARWGHFHVLQWAIHRKCKIDYTVVAAAAEGGHLQMMLYVRSCLDNTQSSLGNSTICPCAASGGHLHILEWARQKEIEQHDERFPWNGDTVRMAAYHGHLKVFQWGLEKNCYLYRGPSVMGWAASSGSIELLEWLADNAFERDTATTRLAAMRGHLHVLKWVHAREWQLFDHATWDTAVRKQRSEIVVWLREIGCPGS